MTLSQLEGMVATLRQVVETTGTDPRDMEIMAQVGNGKLRRVSGWSWGQPKFQQPTFRIH